MALTATTTFDISGGTQTITFNNPSQVDQITYSGGNITFGSISSFNLAKSDLLLYINFLSVFNNLLFKNFPSVNSNVNGAFPLCQFDISETFAGVTHLTYSQTSAGASALSINYVPVALAASVAARGSPVTVSLQEFFMTVYMLTQYAVQVNLN